MLPYVEGAVGFGFTVCIVYIANLLFNLLTIILELGLFFGLAQPFEERVDFGQHGSPAGLLPQLGFPRKIRALKVQAGQRQAQKKREKKKKSRELSDKGYVLFPAKLNSKFPYY